MLQLRYFLLFGLSTVVLGSLSAQQSLTLGTFQKNTSVNETVCVPIYARDFYEIVSMQYTLQWNTEQLEFQSFSNFNLPQLSQRNFGLQKRKDGLLTFAWYDPKLRGISLPEGTVLYELCFKVIGGKGSVARLSIVNQPTVIEVSNAQSQLLPLQTEMGKINIR